MVGDHTVFAHVNAVFETELVGDATLGALAQTHFAEKNTKKVDGKFRKLSKALSATYLTIEYGILTFRNK